MVANDEQKSVPGLGRKTDDWLEEYGDLLGVVPYAEEVVAAYRIVRTRRVRSFLRGLVGATAEFSEAEQTRFRAYIDSRAGRELLADFADSALRTRTRTATASLAILYADHDDRQFSADFKPQAVVALEGLTERSIDAFILLTSGRDRLFAPKGEGPYPVVVLRAAALAENPELARWSTEGRAWVAVVADLISRGMLDPDFAAGARLGDGDWVAYFAISDFSTSFERLLTRARTYLEAGERSA